MISFFGGPQGDQGVQGPQGEPGNNFSIIKWIISETDKESFVPGEEASQYLASEGRWLGVYFSNINKHYIYSAYYDTNEKKYKWNSVFLRTGGGMQWKNEAGSEIIFSRIVEDMENTMEQNEICFSFVKDENHTNQKIITQKGDKRLEIVIPNKLNDINDVNNETDYLTASDVTINQPGDLLLRKLEDHSGYYESHGWAKLLNKTDLEENPANANMDISCAEYPALYSVMPVESVDYPVTNFLKIDKEFIDSLHSALKKTNSKNFKYTLKRYPYVAHYRGENNEIYNVIYLARTQTYTGSGSTIAGDYFYKAIFNNNGEYIEGLHVKNGENPACDTYGDQTRYNFSDCFGYRSHSVTTSKYSFNFHPRGNDSRTCSLNSLTKNSSIENCFELQDYILVNFQGAGGTFLVNKSLQDDKMVYHQIVNKDIIIDGYVYRNLIFSKANTESENEDQIQIYDFVYNISQTLEASDFDKYPFARKKEIKNMKFVRYLNNDYCIIFFSQDDNVADEKKENIYIYKINYDTTNSLTTNKFITFNFIKKIFKNNIEDDNLLYFEAENKKYYIIVGLHLFLMDEFFAVEATTAEEEVTTEEGKNTEKLTIITEFIQGVPVPEDFTDYYISYSPSTFYENYLLSPGPTTTSYSDDIEDNLLNKCLPSYGSVSKNYTLDKKLDMANPFEEQEIYTYIKLK